MNHVYASKNSRDTLQYTRMIFDEVSVWTIILLPFWNILGRYDLHISEMVDTPHDCRWKKLLCAPFCGRIWGKIQPLQTVQFLWAFRCIEEWKLQTLRRSLEFHGGLHRIYPLTSLHPLISCLMELTFCSGFYRLLWRPDAGELPGEARFTRKNFWISDWLAVFAGHIGEMRNNRTTERFFDATNTHWFHLISWFFAIAILLTSVGIDLCFEILKFAHIIDNS